MVSIFADTIIDDTTGFSFNDGQNIGSTTLSFTETASLTDFLYLDRVRFIFSTDVIDVRNEQGSNINCSIGYNIDFLINGIKFDSVSGVSGDEEAPGQSNTSFSFDGDNTVIADTYIDSPLTVDVTYVFNESEGFGFDFDGAQTVNFDLEIRALGRKV
jgi:hypothetical protein